MIAKSWDLAARAGGAAAMGSTQLGKAAGTRGFDGNAGHPDLLLGLTAPLDDVQRARRDPRLQAVLPVLQKQARSQTLQVDDMRTVLSAGDASAVRGRACGVVRFNTIARLAEAFRFSLPSAAAGAKYLLARGYR